jgi:hypothetical protein
VRHGPGVGRRKGLTGPVLVDRRIVQGWDSTPIALREWSDAEPARTVAAGPAATRAGFAVATVPVDTPADTFLALPGSCRGLGRYWEIGPQVTLAHGAGSKGRPASPRRRRDTKVGRLFGHVDVHFACLLFQEKTPNTPHWLPKRLKLQWVSLSILCPVLCVLCGQPSELRLQGRAWRRSRC